MLRSGRLSDNNTDKISVALIDQNGLPMYLASDALTRKHCEKADDSSLN